MVTSLSLFHLDAFSGTSYSVCRTPVCVRSGFLYVISPSDVNFGSNSWESPLFSKFRKASWGRISFSVEAQAYFSGLQWNEVGGRVMVFWGQGLEPALALVKREGDWGNVLNTCNRWNLVNVWVCLGGWEGDEEEERIVSREPELHGREEGVQEKKIDWYHKFLPITFHFQVMKAVEQKSWSRVAPARWDKFLEEISTKCTPKTCSGGTVPKKLMRACT